MINILWSDDQFNDQNHMLATKENALCSHIKVSAFPTWEQAQLELESNFENYDAIILDGKGQRKVDSPTSDSKHLSEAMTWLSNKNGTLFNLPIIVYTGFHEIINESWEGNEFIYEIIPKTDWNKLEKTIKKAVGDSKNILIRKEYKNSWKIFSNGFLSTTTEGKFLSLIKKINSESYSKSDFNTIREILEEILLKFNEVDSSENFLPNDVLKENGGINLDWSLRILNGQRTEIKFDQKVVRIIEKNINPVIEKGHYISYTLTYLKETSSALSHITKYSIQKETFKSILYALLEVLNWANGILESKLEA